MCVCVCVCVWVCVCVCSFHFVYVYMTEKIYISIMFVKITANQLKFCHNKGTQIYLYQYVYNIFSNGLINLGRK